MARLDKLSPGTIADADTVAGSAVTPGNDNKLKTHLAAIALRHKSARWSNHTYTRKIFNAYVPTAPTMAYGRASSYSGSTYHGMWLKHAVIYVKTCMNTAVAATNAVTVRLYKTSARTYGEHFHTPSNELTTVNLVEEFTLPCVSGVHDSRHVVLPISRDFIAKGEHWALQITSLDSGKGIQEGYLVLQFAELHTE